VRSRPHLLGLLCCGLLLFLLTACSVVEAGAPVPVDDAERPDTTSTSTEGGSDPLDGLAPCEVLTDEDEAEIGLEKGEQLGDQGCDWKKTFEVGVLVMLFPEDGAGALPEQGSPVDVGNFDAYLFERPEGVDGSCSLVMDISSSSYLTVTAISEKNTDAACNLAVSVAERVDDQLS
jgi:hypothetical protein